MPFKKGQSGNPAGRPKKGSSFAELLRDIGEEDLKGTDMTKKEAVSRKLWAEASKGESWAIRELFDRIDGKAVQQIISENENRVVFEHEIVDDNITPDQVE